MSFAKFLLASLLLVAFAVSLCSAADVTEGKCSDLKGTVDLEGKQNTAWKKCELQASSASPLAFSNVNGQTISIYPKGVDFAGQSSFAAASAVVALVAAAALAL